VLLLPYLLAVLNNLCIYADSEMTKPIAMATLHEANLRHFLKGKALPGVNAEGDHLDTLAANPKVIDAVLKEINGVGKKAGLKGAEVLGGLILDAEEWTVRSQFSSPFFPFELDG